MHSIPPFFLNFIRFPLSLMSWHVMSCHVNVYTGLFKMIVEVQLSSGNSAPNSGNSHHLTVPFEGGMHSFNRQGACVYRNRRYESEPPLKPSPLTCYRQFETNSVIVLIFLESQRVHIYRAPVSYVTKTWSVVLLNKKCI
jgi:hypothetical protein